MKNSRLNFIDIARALAIIFIVFGHIIVHNQNSYWLFKWIYSFHVVLFFIISGYVYNSQKSSKELITKKFTSLMIPYFIFSILFLIPYHIFFREVNTMIHSNGSFHIMKLLKEILYGVGYGGALKQNTSLWFLPALFTTEVLFKILSNFTKKINPWLQLTIFFLISYIATKMTIVLPWGINTALVFLLFYDLGKLLKEKKLIEKIMKKKKYLYLESILVIFAIYISQINNTISCVDYRYGNYFYFISTSIIFSMLILMISYQIKKNKTLEIIGRNTLSILIFHKLIVLFFQVIIQSTKNILLVGNIYLCLFLAIGICILSIIISIGIGTGIKKYLPWLYGNKGKWTIKETMIELLRDNIKGMIYILNHFSMKKRKVEISEEELIKETGYQTKELYDFKEFEIKKERIDLSIIIPVYNSEKYLPKCLDSVFQQETKYQYQVICINDGSTDSSLKILKQYQKKYSNMVIITQKNKGISGARNTGIKNAEGKYIGFIDNDDYVSKDYVEELLNNAYAENADIVKCNFVNYWSDNKEKIQNVIRHQDAVIKGPMKEKIIEYKGFIWSGIIHRRLWEKVRFPIGYWYEDMITRIIIMRLSKKFIYLDKNLYFYNMHQTNASKTLWKSSNIKCLDQYFLTKKLLEESDKLKIEDNGEVYLILLEELGNILWLRTRSMKKNTRKKVFYLACKRIERYKINSNYQLTFEEKSLKTAFTKKNYLIWYLTSLYIMLGVKYLGR